MFAFYILKQKLPEGCHPKEHLYNVILYESYKIIFFSILFVILKILQFFCCHLFTQVSVMNKYI